MSNWQKLNTNHGYFDPFIASKAISITAYGMRGLNELYAISGKTVQHEAAKIFSSTGWG